MTFKRDGNLVTESVESATLAFQGTHQVHGHCNLLLSSVLSVSDSRVSVVLCAVNREGGAEDKMPKPDGIREGDPSRKLVE